MRYVSVAQMREADRRCIEDVGIPGAVLMNNAGAAVFAEIHEGPVGIVCGKGNNGGDGYVVARLSMLAGYETHVLHIGDPREVVGDARVFRDAFIRLGGEVWDADDGEAVLERLGRLSKCAVLVDAMLGTGVMGDVRGGIRVAIDHWPALPTIAVDLPSGLNADSGDVCGNCVAVDVTVTFQFAKTGFRSEDAKHYVGRLVVADIGIPEICADDTAWRLLGLGT